MSPPREKVHRLLPFSSTLGHAYYPERHIRPCLHIHETWNGSPRLLLRTHHILMSFLAKLFGKKPDPTAAFPIPPVPVSLVWDTASGTLNGIPLGAPITALEPFGPCPEIRHISAHTTYFAYPDLGLLLEFSHGMLEFITVVISESEYNPIGESSAYASLTIQPAGEVLTANLEATELTRLLGPFELMDKDEEEMVGIFRTGDLCHEATFAPDARLVSLVIYRDE